MLEAHTLVTLNNPNITVLTLELTFDDRQKSRHKATTTCGQSVGWFIERGYVLKEGDVLQSTNEIFIKITAAHESVSTVYAKTALDLTRAAYHLANRHVPLQITANFLPYQHDHVLDDMVRGLGLNVECESAAFNPEAGAYAAGQNSHARHSHTHSGHAHHHHEH